MIALNSKANHHLKQVIVVIAGFSSQIVVD